MVLSLLAPLCCLPHCTVVKTYFCGEAYEENADALCVIAIEVRCAAYTMSIRWLSCHVALPAQETQSLHLKGKTVMAYQCNHQIQSSMVTPPPPPPPQPPPPPPPPPPPQQQQQQQKQQLTANYSLRHRRSYHIPSSRTDRHKDSPIYKSLYLFNSLPENIKNTRNCAQFKF